MRHSSMPRVVIQWFPRLRSVLIAAALGWSFGCQPIQPYYLNEDGDLSHYLDVATQIDYPDIQADPLPDVVNTRSPITLASPEFDGYWDVTLEEVMSMALQNSKVLPTLGGLRQLGQATANPPSRISAAPDGVATIYDVAIQESGQSGVEQILSNFDAVFRSTTTWDSNDRPQNLQPNIVQSPFLQSDQINVNNEISKLTAGGGQWFFRNVSIYDGANNQLTRETRNLPSSWFTALEAEVRQPLLRGRGVQLNRIPVVLARMRTDVVLADFQEGVENLLRETEHVYWELYFSYRNLEAARQGRDSALTAWQRVSALAGEPSGSKDRQSQAREQFYTFEVALKDAKRNLQIAETRLRFLMGLTPTDGRFLRPIDEPTIARVEFDWHQIHCESLTLSNELRRQRWRVKQRELELIAAKNQLLPQVDAVALYRWLGVGDDFHKSGTTPPFPGVGSSAVNDLFSGDFQEFRLGFSAEVNLGFRQEMAQVRHQQLQLVRARAQLETAELEITHQITNAYQDIAAAYEVMQGNYNRRIAAASFVEAAEVGQEQGNVELFNLLEAQRRQAEADIAYYQSVFEYNLAIANLHQVKGTLLAYNNVLLAEGPWPDKAYFDAQNLARQRDASYYLDYGYSRPKVQSRGPVDLHSAPECEHCAPGEGNHPLATATESPMTDGMVEPMADGMVEPMTEGMPPAGEAVDVIDSPATPASGGREPPVSTGQAVDVIDSPATSHPFPGAAPMGFAPTGAARQRPRPPMTQGGPSRGSRGRHSNRAAHVNFDEGGGPRLEPIPVHRPQPRRSSPPVSIRWREQ